MNTPTPPASPAEANRPPDHGTPGLELRQLRAQVALCREVLAEVTPIVKARICMSPAGVDESVLGRIEQAINQPASERETLTPDAAAFRTHHLAETSRLTKELLELRAAFDGLKSHHDLCRAEAGAPDDDVLLETIKALKADAERLRAVLGTIVKADDEAIAALRSRGLITADYDPVVAKCAREALAATPASVTEQLKANQQRRNREWSDLSSQVVGAESATSAPVEATAFPACANYEQLRDELGKLPRTWYPDLLRAMTLYAQDKKVFAMKVSDFIRHNERLRVSSEELRANIDEAMCKGQSAAPPSTSTYPLFKHMSDAYGLTLVESELDEIRQQVARGGTVVPIEEAEALATALQGVVDGYSSALISYDAERLKNVLATYRSRHPAPKEPLP